MLNYGCGRWRERETERHKGERDSCAALTPQIAERESSSAWIKWHSPLKGWVGNERSRGYLPRLGWDVVGREAVWVGGWVVYAI